MEASEKPRAGLRLPDRDADGQLPKWAWPGGYPVAYYSDDGETYCASCASQDDAEPPITMAEVNWEDSELYCDGCGERIESAYAEPR